VYIIYFIYQYSVQLTTVDKKFMQNSPKRHFAKAHFEKTIVLIFQFAFERVR